MVIFNIGVYNIMIPVLPPVRIYGQYERVTRIKDVVAMCEELYPLDVMVLNEVIPPSIESTVLEDMSKLNFKYHSKPIQDILTEKGGIIIFSKYPVLENQYTLFGDACIGTDCLSAKGIVYIKVAKESQNFNIFATHLQAWSGGGREGVRTQQMKTMSTFITQMKIPTTEAVFLCGDLNIDLYTSNAYFKHIMYNLGFNVPRIHTDSHPFTVDPELNNLVGSDDPDAYRNEEWPNGCVAEYRESKLCVCCSSEWIDYTLVSKNHRKPTDSFMYCAPLKVPKFSMPWNTIVDQLETQDVSDHFPVIGHFEFDSSLGWKSTLQSNLEAPRVDSNPNSVQTTIFVILIVLVSLAVACLLMVGSLKIWKYRKKTPPGAHRV
jgi:endonuclease/exonuclease/phosphatase family metal-dependent hydrolase